MTDNSDFQNRPLSTMTRPVLDALRLYLTRQRVLTSCFTHRRLSFLKAKGMRSRQFDLRRRRRSDAGNVRVLESRQAS